MSLPASVLSHGVIDSPIPIEGIKDIIGDVSVRIDGAFRLDAESARVKTVSVVASLAAAKSFLPTLHKGKD